MCLYPSEPHCIGPQPSLSLPDHLHHLLQLRCPGSSSPSCLSYGCYRRLGSDRTRTFRSAGASFNTPLTPTTSPLLPLLPPPFLRLLLPPANPLLPALLRPCFHRRRSPLRPPWFPGSQAPIRRFGLSLGLELHLRYLPLLHPTSHAQSLIPKISTALALFSITNITKVKPSFLPTF